MTAQFETTFANLGSSFGSYVAPTALKDAQLLHYNSALAANLGLDLPSIKALTTASDLPANCKPFAMVYAGHQFGGYSPQMGDGRGVLLGELGCNQQLWDLHLKGVGKTPYSRFGDGRAVLRSSLREYLGSNAMQGLQIPTTQALAIATTSEQVRRESLEPGAVLLRVSQCHIRFGHFEYFYYQNMQEEQAQLINYCAQRYLNLNTPNTRDNALALLDMATQNTAKLIAQWQAIGFAHGVLNTDNMSLIGETFDFGPFAFLDDFEPGHICNHSDDQGRYAFDRQANIGLWNLNALAHALSNFIDIADIKNTLAAYEKVLSSHYYQLMMTKLGLSSTLSEDNQQLLQQLLKLLAQDRTDYTYFFRTLSRAPDNALDLLIDRAAGQAWLEKYRACSAHIPESQRTTQMLAVNPKYILRNYLAQQVIESTNNGDLSRLDQLLSVLASPFEEHPALDHLAQPPADKDKHLAVSCSS
ncbi:YdiU family protein [Simiduia curdlanivorans]|uniref:Protein nucleotidyltransferase YdiU n=1 Tax=Simiduia curdlanivorans TaxID=1492769 RepID=A0ABV8V5S5_9GAMM|nr:YdiU family protein [Simiduia curdlanivorans]MDN3638574.1 YdiU family protein [Simiduia curdlanivorans]